MAQVVITGPDGTVMFSCRGGEEALVNLPEAPSPQPIIPHVVSTSTVPASYAAVQTQVDDLHTKTMDFFSKWLKTGNAGGNTTIAGSTSTLMSGGVAEAVAVAADEEAAEDDGGQLDLDTEGGELTDGKSAAGSKLSGSKTART